jgi:hypothetical protein
MRSTKLTAQVRPSGVAGRFGFRNRGERHSVAADGQPFLIGAEGEPSIRRAVTVILNWPAVLNK